MNSVELIGRLTKDPELPMSNGGEPVCSLRLAVDRMGDYMRIGSRLFTVSPMDFLREGGVKLTKAVRDMEKRVASQRAK